MSRFGRDVVAEHGLLAAEVALSARVLYTRPSAGPSEGSQAQGSRLRKHLALRASCTEEPDSVKRRVLSWPRAGVSPEP